MGIPENKSKTGEISQDYLQKVMLIYILCFMDDIFINRKQGSHLSYLEYMPFMDMFRQQKNYNTIDAICAINALFRFRHITLLG